MSTEQSFIDHLQADLRYARERGDRYKELATHTQAELEKTKIDLADASRKAAEQLLYGPRGQCRAHGCADAAVTPDGLCNGHAE